MAVDLAYMLENLDGESPGDLAVAPGATVRGLVVMGDGSSIGEGRTVDGPVSVDTGATVGDDDTR